MIWIAEALPLPCKQDTLFDLFMQCRGEVYRAHKNRRTQQICIEGQTYFLKQHHATGWREIMRHLRTGRLPILDARQEWHAIHRLQALGIATLDPCGVGWRGRNPARRESFLLTRALPSHITLETLAKTQLHHPLPIRLKWQIITAVGTLAGTLHRHGINHRDFYLCHLLLDRRSLQPEAIKAPPLIHVIDLHRAGLRRKTPLRWILKDLAGLDFSSREAGLTTRDRLRFQRAYEAAAHPLHRSFWQKVKKRGDQLIRKHGT